MSYFCYFLIFVTLLQILLMKKLLLSFLQLVYGLLMYAWLAENYFFIDLMETGKVS